jgi:steroid 5-alpha reductase family enzyme
MAGRRRSNGSGSSPAEGADPKPQRHAVGEGAIRKIFPAFVLVMWICVGLLIAQGRWTPLNWFLALEAASACAVVFINFAFVFNYGYATSVILLNLTILLVRGFTVASVLICGALMIYGLRLWTFSALRYRSRSFASNRRALDATHTQLPMFVKVLVYVQTLTLMTFHAMTSYNVATSGRMTVCVGVGVVVLLAGLALEGTADRHKQRAKAADPWTFVSTGPFSRSRHPNYLGEILVQSGVIIAGLASAHGAVALVAAILAPLYIIILMFSMVARGEAMKAARYGEDSQFQAYTQVSGPLVPRFGSKN